MNRLMSFALVGSMGLLAVTAAPALAQKAQDERGSKDHPMLTRFPDSRIVEYKKNFDAVEIATGTNADGNPRRERIEGDATRIVYFHNIADKQPSPLQLIRNYQNAIKSIGGEVIYERLPRDTDGGETTLKAVVSGKEVFVRVEPGIFSAPTQSYLLHFVERAAMQQVVTANKLLDELNAKGFITLYINFDTNKWDIKPDAQPTLAEVVKALKASPNMKVSIEGHTDNVGQAATNKTLSENRAKSVMNALVAQGVPAVRLSAAGFGQEKPIADNRSEEGRAKNRRVEIVKK
jgi:outer membrane protein OmpA-like peptidoglycan-associated protein